MQIAKLTKSVLNVYVLLLLAVSIGAGAANFVGKQTYVRLGGTADSVNAVGESEFSNSIVAGL